MPEVLSQSQIDELLNSMMAGSAPVEEEKSAVGSGKKIKEYNFKTPKKLAKEQIKTLQGIHENFSRYLSSYLSGILRTYCEITVNSIEELPYYEYNNALPDIEMMGIYTVNPIEGFVMVDISNSITFCLIDRLLGGSGNSPVLDREFTEIEVSLMRRIFHQIALYIQEAWPASLNLKSELIQIETNARLFQSLPVEEIVIIVSLDVAIDETKGSLSFCIPCINLENIITQVNKNKMMQIRQSDSAYEEKARKAMHNHVQNSVLEVSGLFGSTRLSFQEVCNLHVGDVIRLDQAGDADMQVIIGNKVWFYGIPGVKRNRKAIKVKKVL